MSEDVAVPGEGTPTAGGTEVWVVAGDEGHVYGIAATEVDAYALAGREARQSIFECSDNLPEDCKSADDVRIFWLIRATDGRRERELIASETYLHVGGGDRIHGSWYIAPALLPAASSPVPAAGETKP